MIRVCAWCRLFLGIRSPFATWDMWDRRARVPFWGTLTVPTAERRGRDLRAPGAGQVTPGVLFVRSAAHVSEVLPPLTPILATVALV